MDYALYFCFSQKKKRCWTNDVMVESPKANSSMGNSAGLTHHSAVLFLDRCFKQSYYLPRRILV